MIERTVKPLRRRVLVVDDELGLSTAEGRAVRAIVDELRAQEIDVVEAATARDGLAVAVADAGIHAILLDWHLGDDTTHAKARALLAHVRERNAHVPIFLTSEHGSAASSIPVEVMEQADEFIWTLEDTAPFVAGRVVAAIDRYAEAMLPPMMATLMRFAGVYEYSWHTPGHTGGTAFLKSPVGRLFHDYFGENLLRSDLSISITELGSLLDHTGAIGAGERYAARVFGAHRTYCGTNGTSTSNRVIVMASVGRGQVALCDRNCHKSIEHGLTMTGGIPTYLVPTRNRYGIIGPIPPARLAANAIAAAVASNPLLPRDADRRPVYAVVTNSTYDGLCYRATRVQSLLERSVDRIHFDEAWYAYARFNPIYRERYAMHGDPKDHEGPTVFATHSTHKLLAALSQASFIHVRDGKSAIPHARFNEAFMMHASTSPFYPLIASNDVTAAMMDGPGGRALTTEAIEEAVAFRQTVGRIRKQFVKKREWFFRTWNPETVEAGRGGRRVAFEDAPADRLTTDPDCWVLRPGERWHGFEGLEDGYCMLDPIKVSIVTPGVADRGGLEARGIPATLVTAYLHQQGVEVEKTTDFTILLLFSIGITKGKWGTLVNALLDFKRDHDANAPLAQVLPALTHPRYAGLGLRDLGDEMFAQLKGSGQTRWLADAFSALPEAVMTPADAYQRLVRGEVDRVPLDDAAGRVVATGVVPYPPGIPMLMPGERTGGSDGAYLRYLRALREWDRAFPAFGHDTHGVEVEAGEYFVSCIRE
jgi:arginine/lysine/ornithine decarboxylase